MQTQRKNRIIKILRSWADSSACLALFNCFVTCRPILILTWRNKNCDLSPFYYILWICILAQAVCRCAIPFFRGLAVTWLYCAIGEQCAPPPYGFWRRFDCSAINPRTRKRSDWIKKLLLVTWVSKEFFFEGTTIQRLTDLHDKSLKIESCDWGQRHLNKNAGHATVRSFPIGMFDSASTAKWKMRSLLTLSLCPLGVFHGGIFISTISNFCKIVKFVQLKSRI